MMPQPRADTRRFVALALGWHVLWAAFLLPYAVVIALVLGGQQAAQDLVDSLAQAFFVPIIFVAASLLPNLLVAGLTRQLLRATSAGVELIASGLIFGLGWLVAGQVLLPVSDLGGAGGINPVAIWAGLAGTAYGLALPLLDG
ncbi:MAG TPA: hypothetical protein VKR24_09880 [Candidatus Limnocylindrales bacterium]|nr:hypothetical protein [Candidatus Limnocylindrales bacterium]